MAAGKSLLNRAAFVVFGIISSAAFAAGAGTVTHLSGSLSAQRPDGSARILSQRSEVNPGDVLTTERDSYAQVNFTDGSAITLRPNSSVRVEAYGFAKDKPQEDNMFLRLLKGGLRTVTGLVGRRGNQDAYKIGTQQATIGIRGSSGDTLECSEGCPGVTPTSDKLPPGAYHATHTGIYILQNAAGSALINPGQFGYIRDAKTLPSVLPKDPGLSLGQLPFSLPPGGPSPECTVR
ncbi:MAG: hypothetical protein A3F74_05255 [Betaproteobacteria bacterium RIFCSPLOWO2_12_FULL_62_58]|nr:MAG: hypothetical protein A3F74_05255 [Betaproteobacteria bacterium RIFCSPLOWO2_12_FULL_62_58]